MAAIFTLGHVSFFPRSRKREDQTLVLGPKVRIAKRHGVLHRIVDEFFCGIVRNLSKSVPSSNQETRRLRRRVDSSLGRTRRVQKRRACVLGEFVSHQASTKQSACGLPFIFRFSFFVFSVRPSIRPLARPTCRQQAGRQTDQLAASSVGHSCRLREDLTVRAVSPLSTNSRSPLFAPPRPSHASPRSCFSSFPLPCVSSRLEQKLRCRWWSYFRVALPGLGTKKKKDSPLICRLSFDEPFRFT